jgi:hypothetical protein
VTFDVCIWRKWGSRTFRRLIHQESSVIHSRGHRFCNSAALFTSSLVALEKPIGRRNTAALAHFFVSLLLLQLCTRFDLHSRRAHPSLKWLHLYRHIDFCALRSNMALVNRKHHASVRLRSKNKCYRIFMIIEKNSNALMS